MIQFIIIILIILIIFLIIPKVYEYYDNIKLDIGNQISAYFFHLGLAILQKKNFVNNEKNSHKNNFFFQSLPSHIKYEFDDIYNCLSSKGIKYENFSSIWDIAAWEIEENDRYYFWKCMKPLIHKILNETFKKCGLEKKIKYPIIHFRCADTPFNYHPSYHFQYYSFFTNALDKLNKKYDKILLMSCSFHKSNENRIKSCNIYTNSLQDYLKKNKYDSEIICNSNIDDFATLFYAPAIISTGSSFSFMSGFFGNGIYISTELKSDGSYNCNSCNDIILQGYNLLHENVIDYHDTAKVINLLKND